MMVVDPEERPGEVFHPSASSIRIYLLGPMRLYRQGRSIHLVRRHARWLLAYLLYEPGPHRREKVAALLWPHLPSDQARQRLSRTIWYLRHILGPEYIRSEEGFLQCTGSFWCDLHLFRRGIHSQDLQQVEEALELYTGDFLEECALEWAVIAREHLRNEYLTALRRLVVAYRRQGAYPRALYWVRRLLDAAPLQEWGYRESMRLHVLLGDFEGARHQYARLAQLLQRELQTTPSPATQALLAEIESLEVETTLPPLLPLVDRHVEQRALLHILENARRFPQEKPTWALIRGPMGVGKTALLSVLRRAAQRRGMYVLWGEARPHLANDVDLLVYVLRERLSPFWQEAVTLHLPANTREILAPLLPHLASEHQMSPRFEEVNRTTLADALVDFLLALAHITPLLLVLEDVHLLTMDQAFLLERLAERATHSPLAVFLTARHEVLAPLPEQSPWLVRLEDRGILHILDLPPLSREHLRRLAEQALRGPLKERLADELFRISGGVPGIALLWISAAREGGYLRREGGEWRWAEGQALWTPVIPSAASDIGHAFLEQLPPSRREHVILAAVLGPSLQPETWARVVGEPEGKAWEILLALCRMYLLVEEGVQCRWRSEGLRRMILAAVPERKKQRLHARIAHVLLDMQVPPRDAALHVIRGGLLSDHLDVVLTALEEAFQQGALYDVCELGEESHRQMAHLPSLPQQAWRVYLYLGKAYWRLRRSQEAQEAMARAWDLVQKEGEDGDKVEVLKYRALVASHTGNWQDAVSLAQLALPFSRAAKRPRQTGMLLELLANAATIHGEPDKAITYRREALRLYHEARAWEDAARCLGNLGTDHFYALRHWDALRYLHRSIRLLEDLGFSAERYNALQTLGHVYTRLGQYEKAVNAFERVVQARYSGQTPSHHPMSTTWLGLGYAYIRVGNFSRGEAILQQEAQRSLAEDNFFVWALTQRHLGMLAFHRGNLGRARDVLKFAWEHVRGKPVARHVLALPLALGQVYRYLGDVESALQWHRWALRQAFALAPGYPFYRVLARIQLALSLLLLGFPRTARRLLERAESLAEVLDEPPLRVQVALAQSQVALVRGDMEVAWAAVERARIAMETVDDVLLRVETSLWQGKVAWHAGHIDVAREAFAQGERLARKHNLLLWHWELAYGLGRTTEDEEKRRALWQAAVRDVEKLALSLPREERGSIWGKERVRRLLTNLGVRGVCPRARRVWVELPSRASPETLVSVLWTVHGGLPDMAKRRRGKAVWQRHRILRLLHEAWAQGAIVPVSVLGETLDISSRTVRRYVRALEQEGLCRRMGGYIWPA